MDDVQVRAYDRYDVDVINADGKRVTYKSIFHGAAGILPDDTLIEERKVGKTVWINVHHYNHDVDMDAEYTPYPDACVRCTLYFDTEGNLVTHDMALKPAIAEYRHAFCICRQYPELLRFVPYLIRWLHDNDPTNEGALRL